MIERPMPGTEAWCGFDRCADIIACALHGVTHGEPLRQTRRDTTGQRATGAMRVA
jgi:hypothetical protein